MVRSLVIVLGAITVAVPALSTAQPKRPMALGDLLTAVRIGDPQVSPDGKRVLYVRTTTDAQTGRRNGDIWSVPAAGGAPAMFIGGERGENSPRFSADGSRIAFISSRDGAPQVYVTDATGRTIRRITNLSGGVQPPLIMSADGKRVAYVSDVYPSCPDEACNKRTREAAESDPVKVRRLTSLGYRHWDEWRIDVRHHVIVTDVESGATRDVTPGDFDAPQHFYEDNAIAFSPDGLTLAFSSNHEGRDREMWSTNRDVWTVPVAGGALRKLTNNPAADEQPVFSPDGRTIAMRSQRRAGFESDRWYIDLYDVGTGAKRTLFTAPDLSVDDFRFTPDGRTIVFAAAQQGAHNVYSIPANGGAPRLIVQGGSVSQFGVANDAIVFAKSTLTSPADVFRVAFAGGEPLQLTRENAGWLGQVEMPAVNSATVRGAGNTPVQYWLIKPPRFDATKKYPVVFLIHGGPQGDWPDGWSTRWNPALWASQGWVVAAPNPRGSTGFGQTFVDEISQDWCGKVMTDINAVAAAVSGLPYADTQKMGIAGASYGGYAVNWIIGHDNRFKAAVSHDGVFNLESMAMTTEEFWFTDWEFGGPPSSARARANYARCSPHLTSARIRTPTLVITNDQDFRVPVDQGLQLFTMLRRSGVPSEVLNFPDEGHWVLGMLNSKRWHESVFAWMRKYLGT